MGVEWLDKLTGKEGGVDPDELQERMRKILYLAAGVIGIGLVVVVAIKVIFALI